MSSEAERRTRQSIFEGNIRVNVIKRADVAELFGNVVFVLKIIIAFFIRRSRSRLLGFLPQTCTLRIS